MAELTLIKLTNPFNPHEREVQVIPMEQQSLLGLKKQYMEQLFNKVYVKALQETPNTKVDIVISVNGRVISEELYSTVMLKHGDYITLIPKVEGDDILHMVAFVALAVVALGAGQFWALPAGASFLGSTALTFGAAAPFMGAMVTVGTMMLGGFLLNSLLPAARPEMPTIDSGFDTSQTYTFSPQTLQTQGAVIPKIYGLHKVYGNVISTYTEVKDKEQKLNVLICLGLGPVSRVYDLKLNDQPIEALEGVEKYVRLGYLNQELIPNFNDTKTQFAMSHEIKYGVPYTYVTIGDSFNGLEVDLTFPKGLYYSNDSGGLSTVTVRVSVGIRKHGTDDPWRIISQQADHVTHSTVTGYWSTGYWVWYEQGAWVSYWYETGQGGFDPYSHVDGQWEWVENDPENYWRWETRTDYWYTDEVRDYVDVSGAQTETITRTFVCHIPPIDEGQYDIQVTKLTADRTNFRYGQDVYLTTVREVYTDDFIYPRSALVAFRALASGQLSGSLRASFMVEGSIIKYYDGTTWHIGYNNNPAWVCYDILTQPVFKDDLSGVWRYDGYNPSYIDTLSFYAWAQFCDTQVDDGLGGTEKRFTFNVIFDAEMNMWEAALKVASSTMAALIWDGNKIYAILDTITTPSQLFTVGNILQDSFKLTYLPFQDRASEIEANFTNIDKNYERDTYTLVNPNILTKSNKVSIDSFGLVKPSEVWRVLNHHLLCNEKLKRTLSIDVDIEAITSQVGDVILIQHDVPLWGVGGTIISATSNTITLDKEVVLTIGHSYCIVIRLNTDILITKDIISVAGTYTTITIAGSFDDIPIKDDVYHIYDIVINVKPYRIIGFSLGEDQKISLTLQQYDETIYTGVVSPIVPIIPQSLSSKYVEVTDISASSIALVDESGVIKRYITVTYTVSINPFFDSVKIYYKKGENGTWQLDGDTTKLSYNILNVEASTTYYIKVIGVASINGAKLQQTFGSVEAVSITTEGQSSYYNESLQANITGLQIFGQGNDTVFSERDCKFVWSEIQSVDVSYGAGEEPTGAGYHIPPTWFKDYQVTIFDLDGVTIRRIDYTSLPEYIYSYERNYTDGNGVPVREFIIDVRARDRYARISTNPARLQVSNPSPPVVSNVTLGAGVGGFIVSFDPSPVPDVAGYFVYASQTDNFIPSSANLVNTGSDTRVLVNPMRSGIWYIRIAAYDVFGITDLIYSSQYSVVMPNWLENSDIELEFMKMGFQSISWTQFAVFDNFADETKRLNPDTSTYKALISRNSLIQGDSTPNRKFGFLSKIYNSMTTIETGSSTSVGQGYLTDTSKNWFTDECKGLILVDSENTEFIVVSNSNQSLGIVGFPASGAYTLKDSLPTAMVAFCSFQDSTQEEGYGFVKLEVSFDEGVNWQTVLDTEFDIDSLDGTLNIDNSGADYCVRFTLTNDNNGYGPIVYKFLICTDPSPWRF